jgi:hypothetical protein
VAPHSKSQGTVSLAMEMRADLIQVVLDFVQLVAAVERDLLE